MRAGRRRNFWRRGGAAVAGLAGWLLLSWYLGGVESEIGAAPVFVLVTLVCTASVLLTRGLGWFPGLGLGLSVGLATSAGLAAQLPATGPSLAVFIGISSLIFCLLGGVAGAARDVRGRRRKPPVTSVTAGCNPALFPTRRSGSRPTLTYALARMTDDFCAWMDSGVGRQCCIESHDFSGFDQFVRTSLCQHLQAGRVRVYELTPDGAWLEPLARTKALPRPRLPASEGAVAKAISSGQAVILKENPLQPTAADVRHGGVRDRRNPAAPLPAAQAASWPHQDGMPRWLLPLRVGTRAELLVAVARIDVPPAEEQRLAGAVRVQLQLFWRQLSTLRMLSRHLRTDRQTGMLERIELLHHLDELGGNLRGPEPVMILALAVEGLRKLDDSGLWRERDLLIQLLGRALRAKIRADDVLGRFSDERFVVVLHGLDSTLATRVAEKLIDTVRREAVQAVCQAPQYQLQSQPAALKLRAGLAGTGPKRAASLRPFATFDGQSAESPSPPTAAETGPRLLQRALGLVEYARRQRIELATDLMAGVPEWLAPNTGPAAALGRHNTVAAVDGADLRSSDLPTAGGDDGVPA